MSTKCTTSVTKDPKGGFRFNVECGGQTVACGSRTHRAVAEVAAARETSVYQHVHEKKPAAKKPAAKKSAKRASKR